MPKFEYVSFAMDLFEACLRHLEDRLTIVFPTRIAAARAEEKYYPQWAFEDIQFVSIDQLKKDLVMLDQPQPEEDKRLLWLYQSMNEEDRKYFHVYAFDDFVDWGQQFFRFYDELWEELYDPAKLLDPSSFPPGLNLQIWQQENLDRIYEIAQRYQAMIRASGFADRICTDATRYIKLNQQGRSYLFVNQYYYSSLEKELIRQLELGGSSCRILIQAPKDSFDEAKIRYKELDILSVFQSREFNTQSFVCHRYKSLDASVLGLMHRSGDMVSDCGRNSALIDAKLHSSYYAKLLRGLIVPHRAQNSIRETFLYQYLAYIQTDLWAITLTKDESYLPLKNILDRIADQRFTHHLGVSEPRLVKAQLHKLISQDYLYVDIGLKLFDLDASLKDMTQLRELLKAYTRVLKLFEGASSMRELVAILDAPGGFDCKACLSEEQLEHSDLLEKLYEKLANIVSVDALGVVSDWSQLFPGSSRQLSAKILRMLLDSLKTISFKTFAKSTDEHYFDLTNLLDSRNQSYDKVVFFQAQEGILPSAPEPVWILNEGQRRLLGLKTYEQIREWERYYFFRLIFVSRHVEVFCHQNVDKDEQPSSFISELEALQKTEDILPKGFIIDQSVQEIEIKDLFKTAKAQTKLLGIKHEDQTWSGVKPLEFFNIPYEGIEDLGKSGEIKGSYYRLDQMIKSPFIWYIRDLCQLQEIDTQQRQTISRKLFGTVIHQYMAGLMADMAGKHDSYQILLDRFRDKQVLRTALDELLQKPIWIYKLPHNYNWDFLADIIADSIVDTVWWFFNRWLPKLVGDSPFHLIPEEDSDQPNREAGKELPLPDLADPQLRLLINGRADLRLETPNQASIIDFKTGRHSSEQLIIYEWFYYLLDQKRIPEELRSYICKILERDAEAVTISDKKRDKYKETITATLNSILNEGFGIAPKLTNRAQLKEITRADRYGKHWGGEHESV